MWKPRIAVNCDIASDQDSGNPGLDEQAAHGIPVKSKSPARAARLHARVPLDYLDFIAEAGGIPVLVPPVECAAEILQSCDGLLLIGGNDYRMPWRGRPEPRDFDPILERRETVDFALAAESRKCGTPTLGICAGFQLQVLAEDGVLYGDLPSELGGSVKHRRQSGEDFYPTHAVRWQAGNVQWQAGACTAQIEPGEYTVNSSHHQGIRALPAGWQELARSDDGLIEAGCAPRGFRVGVQWHPERDRTNPINRQLIASLIEHARSFRAASREG